MNNLPTLYIRNMVCRRCLLTVSQLLQEHQLHTLQIELGRVKLAHHPSHDQIEAFKKALLDIGLEVIENRNQRIIEGIKQVIQEDIMAGLDNRQMKLSAKIAERLHYEFSYLSDIFSSVEGITIEKYFIRQRVERVKELISYDEYSLSQIADLTGFSSVHHLSTQFKKITGITPSQYKQSQSARTPLDMVA
ncbi:MAG: helix-turn-helix transcriptional regulator [Chitinophagaceae bacterium]|nr:helix-turn-helix transcriptional regulator [Chitinophagaceae bacterium]